MFSRLMSVVLMAGLIGFVFALAVRADDATKAKRVTLTGIGKALRDPGDKPDVSIANATLTVKGKGAPVVYDVYGWGGVIIAKQANGKKVDVTGFLGEKNGRKTITAASVGVKIIVVDEKP